MRLLVLCRRCTRPRLRTPPPSRAANGTGHAAEQHCGRKRKAENASIFMENPMSILVECQQNDGGAEPRVVVDDASPRWLHRFARFFLTRPWNAGLYEMSRAFPVAVAGYYSRLDGRLLDA